MSTDEFSLKSSFSSRNYYIDHKSELFLLNEDKDKILNTLLKLETYSSDKNNTTFYVLVTKYINNLDLNVISRLRYLDWF